VAYVVRPRRRRKKLDSKAAKGYKVGYSNVSKAWRIYIPQARNITESPHVRFDESTFRTTTTPEYHPAEPAQYTSLRG
jgi:hypothetical protein